MITGAVIALIAFAVVRWLTSRNGQQLEDESPEVPLDVQDD